MKNLKKDKEMLSAYIDGELSPREKEYIEGKISSSLELQRELAEMKRFKELTASSYERLDEAPFFETRLTAELNTTRPVLGKVKKWIPAAGLTVITIGLMLTLKFYPDVLKNVLEEQKINLANLYKENLQPLLFAANLTNEDIFNFAFNSELPLDRSEQHYLILGYDNRGKEFFEIKKNLSPSKENNLEKFVQALNLNEDQRKEIDSIIASYSDELMAQVLVSDKNAVAINPSLWNYQKAIAAEILAFAKSKNENVYNILVPVKPPVNDYYKLAQFVRESRPTLDNNYIFITPDTIFTDTFIFDDSAFKKGMVEMGKEIAKANRDLVKFNYRMRFDSTFKKFEKDTSWSDNFTVHIDVDRFRVQVPNIVLKKIDTPLPDMDSLNTIIKDALKKIEVYVKTQPDKPSSKRKLKVEVHSSDSSGIKKFNFDEKSIDSLMKNQFRSLDSLKRFNFDSFNFFNDSLFYNHNEQLRKQIQELQEEMRRFREEMQNFRPDIPATPDTSKPKLKGIEI